MDKTAEAKGSVAFFFFFFPNSVAMAIGDFVVVVVF